MEDIIEAHHKIDAVLSVGFNMAQQCRQKFSSYSPPIYSRVNYQETTITARHHRGVQRGLIGLKRETVRVRVVRLGFSKERRHERL